MTIKPALTAEEWASVGGWRLDPDSWVSVDYVGWCEVENRHAMAAVCLHGQPFGFTREDVEVLKAAAQSVYSSMLSEDASEESAKLLSLADRIEALLPILGG